MMATMDWTPLVATIAGAAIAFSGTVAADHLRRRDSRHRYSYGERQRAYAEMVLALGAALEGLRTVASTVPTQRRMEAADAAVSKAGVYIAREKILMTASPHVASTAEAAFEALIGVRDAVRSDARLRTREFHDPYHPYAERVWRLRMAIREDLDAPRLSAHDLSRGDWSGLSTCDVCNPKPAAVEISR
jgi:hypothetical protein